ncbi:ATP-binding protein [Candidatus Woesearchaeota archaeon]|nr:MAG: ATP-binding protein [Candidatus Woesearchaeota archaeon]
MFDIIIGRSEKDREKYGKAGATFIGRQYVKMGRTTSLSNNVYLDVAGSHVVFVVGKRGSGKSYTMGVICEGMASLPEEVSKNISVIMLDTMGIYWTMKYPNKRDELLLNEWGLKGQGLDVVIYTPVIHHEEYKRRGIPTDKPFSISPAELSAADWCLSFEIKQTEPVGVLIERVIEGLKEKKKVFDIDDIIKEIRKDTKSENVVKNAAENRFVTAKKWGVFAKEGTPIKDLAVGGKVSVLDVSCYATEPNGWKIKSLVVGLISQKLFIQRMEARKSEEREEVEDSLRYFAEEKEEGQKTPLVWLIIDEAHEFLPREGKTTASDALITILREGRQPGISLILASQQPGKIHTDVMTQADTVIAHRITAKLDVDALGLLMQSYMREGLTEQLDNLPRVKGSAIIFDDTNERMYPLRIRPRFTWHGGGSPTAMAKKKEKSGL